MRTSERLAAAAPKAAAADCLPSLCECLSCESALFRIDLSSLFSSRG